MNGAPVRQHQDGLVFADDVTVPAAGLGINGINLAKQKAGRIDVVHQSFVDRQA